MLVLAAALLGAALGAGGVIVAGPSSPAQQDASPPRPSEPARSVDPVAFAPPATDATGLSLTALRPEKVKGGVPLTITLANSKDMPITVDTGALGPHDPRFNGATVPMTMTPVRKKLVPGEGYTYQCVFRLPTMDVGQLAFAIGPVTVSGQAAGD